MFGRKTQRNTDSKSDPDSTSPEEAKWVAQAKAGDSAAFARIVEVYQRPIFNLCYRMLGDVAEAEDAAQEAFIRAFLKLHSYDESRKFSSWLFSIASHYCIDKLRKRRMQWISWEELPPWRWLPSDDKPQPEEAMVEVETTQELYGLLNTLPPDYRAAVVLKYWHDMPYEEIAEALDTTVSAIKSRLFRARKMMAEAARQKTEHQLATADIALAEG
ncbi:MAG: sigma-70 family RNA polymerase sigma factor [Phycisphaerae bacterium]|nr:sigma-70 family RNA polymerase sigma factor [Phycisphaerae bacterium]NIX31364.1 sigma-70 family RNA polymerase sigma factor [Phycisphaerae bacterium]